MRPLDILCINNYSCTLSVVETLLNSFVYQCWIRFFYETTRSLVLAMAYGA